MYMTINVMYRETFYKLNFKNTRNIIKITVSILGRVNKYFFQKAQYYESPAIF